MERGHEACWHQVGKLRGIRNEHALRTSHLPLRARAPARTHQALRHGYAQAVGEARHPPGWVLDNADRRVEPGPDLYAAMGIACRARAEVRRVWSRSGMDLQTCR